MTYPDHGPFTDAAPPGIDQVVMNDINAALLALNNAVSDPNFTSNGSGILTMLGIINNVAPVTVTGTTAGTATLYQFLRGSIKGYVLRMNGYRNSTGTEQTISIPDPPTVRTIYITSNIVANVYKSGSKITGGVAFVSTPASSGGGGIASVVTSTPAQSWGEISPTGGYDALGLGTSMSGVVTGLLFAIGL